MATEYEKLLLEELEEMRKYKQEYYNSLEKISELYEYKYQYHNLLFGAKCLAAFTAPFIFSLFGTEYNLKTLFSFDFWRECCKCQ